jgi:signal transduction histidine kinase
MRGLAVVLVATILAVLPSRAAEFGNRDEAVAMVKRVIDKFAQSGPDATFKAVNDRTNPAFHDRDLYPFVYDLKGINVAHGARPALVGKNLISLKDQNGVYLIQEMIALAKGPGSGWVDYKWPNPITDKIEDKSSYVEKMGDYFVGVGVYRSQPDRS